MHFYKTAIDYAIDNKSQEIIDLLKKGPIKASQTGKETKKEAENKSQSTVQENSSLTLKNRDLEEKIRQIEKTNAQLKDKVSQLKKECNQKSDEINQIKEKNIQLSKENSDLKKEIKNLKDENDKLKEKDRTITEIHKSKSSGNQSKETNNFQILDEEEIKNLEKIEEIGSGGGGKVFKVAMKQFYALKQMIISGLNVKNLQYFIQEYEIMSMLNHPNVLKAIGIFMSSESIPPSILLEYCPMNLQKAIENKILSKEEVVKIIYQIAEAMRYVHFKKIIHRDLKPTNILIASDGTVKLCDFGISKLMTIEEQTMTRGVGSQKFMAPEIINEEDYYDEKVDVYSFGVLVFFILSNGQIPKIKIGDILKGKKAEIPSSFTDFSKNLINSCWNFNSKDRPSFQSIVDSIEKSRFNLIQLNKTEIKSVESFVNEHKTKIPQYTDKSAK